MLKIEIAKNKVPGYYTDYVHSYFTAEVYRKAYSFGLQAINGERMWPKGVGYPVEPPVIRKMPGRPKKKRRRDRDETDPVNPTKLRRSGIVRNCRRCFQQGHNSRGCKNDPVQQPQKQLGKRRRPRKQPDSVDSRGRQVSLVSARPSASKALNKVIAKERAQTKAGIGRLGSSSSDIYYAPPRSGRSSTQETPTNAAATEKSRAK
ncbi:hypothetical protein OROHE_001055 [Orobanche hederae]